MDADSSLDARGQWREIDSVATPYRAIFKPEPKKQER